LYFYFKAGNGSVVLNQNATATGTCGEVEQTLTLKWYQVAEGIQAPKPNILTFTFTKNISNDIYYAKSIELMAYPDLIYFPNATTPGIFY